MTFSKRQRVTVSLDAGHLEAREIAGFFGVWTARVLADPIPLCVRTVFLCDTPQGDRRVTHAALPVTLDLDAKGRPIVRIGADSARIPHAAAWIVDFPVPRTLPVTLFVTPVRGGRMRLHTRRILPFQIPSGF